MEPSRDAGPLNQGGPSDQASQRPDERDQGMLGSQQGRPQVQEERPDRRAPGSPASPRDGWPANARPDEHAPVRGEGEAMSDTERKAGTPDARATTDWRHGAGEPPAAREEAGRPAEPPGQRSRP